MAELTSAEKFWYVLECIAFGAGYFAKLSTAKALSEMPQFHAGGYSMLPSCTRRRRLNRATESITNPPPVAKRGHIFILCHSVLAVV
jgi:hypothetical protein